MKANEIIIFSDMDGTMLTDWNVGPYVPPVNIAAIKRFVSAGGMFSIASGRMFPETLGFFEGIQFSAPLVQGNGAVIYDSVKKKVLEKALLPEAVKLEALEYYGKRKGIWLLAANEEGIYQVQSGDSEWDSSLRDRMRKLISVEEYLSMEPIKVCIYILDTSEVPIVKAEIEALKTAKTFALTQSSPNYLEIIGKDVAKGNGVMKALRFAGAENRKLVCIGDYDNDLSMLELADIAACPEISSPRILEIADIITCGNNEGAIADLICKLELM